MRLTSQSQPKPSGTTRRAHHAASTGPRSCDRGRRCGATCGSCSPNADTRVVPVLPELQGGTRGGPALWGEPGYRLGLDHGDDGTACEEFP